MSQSKKQSWIETLSNTGVGFVGSWIITWITLHYVKDMLTAATVATLLCTVWSIIRGYTIRRLFNTYNRIGDEHTKTL